MFFFNMWGVPYPPVKEKPKRTGKLRYVDQRTRVISPKVQVHQKVKSLSDKVRKYMRVIIKRGRFRLKTLSTHMRLKKEYYYLLNKHSSIQGCAQVRLGRYRSIFLSKPPLAGWENIGSMKKRYIISNKSRFCLTNQEIKKQQALPYNLVKLNQQTQSLNIPKVTPRIKNNNIPT